MRKKIINKSFKKIFIVFLALSIFLIPLSGGLNVFAYSGGLLDQQVLNIGTNVNNTSSTSNAATDDNANTNITLNANYTIWYKFPVPATITGYYLSANGAGNYYNLILYDSNLNVLKTLTSPNMGNDVISSTPNVSYVSLKNVSSYSVNVKEFDVFGNMPIPIQHNEITDLSGSVNNTSASLSWVNPTSNTNFTGVNIYRNGVLIFNGDKAITSFNDKNLSYNTSYIYKVTAKYDDGFETTGITKQLTTPKPHDEISNLTGNASYTSTNLTWSLPDNPYLVGFKIYRNGNLIKTLNTIENYYEDDGLKSGTDYTYKVVALYDDGYETSGVSTSVKTNTKPHDEVTTLNASVSFDSATLTWSPSTNPYLTGFNVYRDSVLIGTVGKTDFYFQDSGLNESTEYNYKVTALYDDDYETFGASILSTTTVKPHDEVGDLTVSSSYNTAGLSWSKPDIPYLLGFNVYRDNQLIKTLDQNVTSYEDDGLAQGTTYSYKVISVYNDGYATPGAVIKTTTKTKPHDEVSNLTADMTYNSAKLSWTIPDNPFLVGFKLYKDDQLIKAIDKTANSYEDTGLTELTSYNYKIVSIYDDDFVTPGVSNTFTTLEDTVIKEVSSAKADAVSYKQINLSWSLPNQHIFHHVNIYRAVEPKKQGLLQSILGTVAFADTAPTEIFETNGTYFNDLTVQPDTNYQYTLTSESTDGTASDPVMVSAQTPVEPTPVYSPSGSYSVNQDGNYVFKWDQPTTGNVKIQIAGQDYKTVDASQQQITIPKADMKTTVWGDPNVAALPIGEYGTTGKTVALGGNSFQSALSMPIQSSDLVSTTMGVVGIVAPIILLTLIILYFRPIKRLIEKAVLKRKARRINNGH